MIRLMTEDDIAKVIELEEKTLHTTLGDYFFKQAIASPLARIYVNEDEKVNGYISTIFDGEIIEVLNFCVDPDVQRSGIGSKLLAHVVENARGASSIILEVRETNQKAISFYYKHGLRLIHKRKGYYSNGEDAYVYQKNIVSIDEIENAYMEVFCESTKYDGYTKYQNDSFKTKYYHNYYKINDDARINELINQLVDKPINGNVSFITNKDSASLDGYEKDHNIYMHSFITNIKCFNKNIGRVELINEANKEEAIKFLYDDGICYGEDYAIGNSKSLVDNSVNGKMKGYLIYDDKKIVGFVNALVYKDASKIEDFFILDDYQHKGYGSTLFNRVIDDLKKNNVNDVYLVADSDDTPKEMYHRMGFNKIGDIYFSRKV